MTRARRAAAFGALLAAGCAPSGDHSAVAARGGATLGLPRDPVALAAMLAVAPESLRAAAEERYGRQAYDTARSILEVEVSRATNARDDTAVARAHMWLGLAAWRLGDYAAARREGDAALAIKRRLHLDAELSRSFNALGLLAWNEGRHHDALAAFDSATATARRNGDAVGVARAAVNVPLVRIELGDFVGGRRGLDSALLVARLVGDRRMEANALANRAMLDVRLGDPAHAVPLLAQARALYDSIGYATGEANALGQLATAFRDLGDLQSAIAAADSGIAIARAHELRQEVASTLEVLADIHSQAGSPRFALRSLAAADSIDERLHLTVERGANLRRASAILYALGELPAAIGKARAALALHDSVNADAESALDQLQLALALGPADARAARSVADSAAHVARRSGNPALVQEAAVVQGELALDRGDPAAALRAIAAAPRTGSARDWPLAHLRARAYLARREVDNARREALSAVAALERQRGSLGAGPLRSAFLGARTGPYSTLVAIELARGDTASAFQVAASVPGRTLVEHLGGVTADATPLHTSIELERILLRIAALERQLAELGADVASERLQATQRALSSARAEYEEEVAHSARSPRGPGVFSTPSLAVVQRRLRRSEALLMYLSGPTRLDLFVVRRRGLWYRPAPVSDRELMTRVRVVREMLASGRLTSSASEALAGLADVLVPGDLATRALRGADHLVIVPHGSLAALPFAALTRNGERLVERYAIAYEPSVALLGRRTDSVSVPTRGVLSIFAPFPKSLPGTLREARSISMLVDRVELHIGAAANPARVRAALTRGYAVHLATHGMQNAQNPLFSRISVAAPDDANDGPAARFEVHDILGLRTRSPLVFLSGCETGLASAGQSTFGETSDDNSLAQAFLLAGVSTVVATLWRVGDTAGVPIATSFYRRMADGAAAEDALALAQRDAIRRGDDPTWAAYTVVGSGARKSAATFRISKADH